MKNSYWMYQHKTAIHFGVDALEKLNEIAGPLAADKKIMIVTDNSGAMKKTGTLDRVIDMLGRERVVVFDRVPPNPPIEIIGEGVDLHRAEGCRLLVGLGGGSSLDTAKSIGVMLHNEGDAADYFLRRKPWGPDCEPVIEIPTTSGTGSECNANFVATLPGSDGKYGGVAASAWPIAAIIDPKLTLSLPPVQTASTGLDALSHAFDSLWSVRAQPLSDSCAFETIPIVLKWLPIAYKDGSNIEARSRMSFASMMGSLAFGNTGTAAMHGMSYILTTKFGVYHGFACAFLMADFFEYNFEALGEERAERVLSLMGVSSRDEGTAKIREFCETLGTPKNLTEIGATKADLPELVSTANPINIGNNAPKLSADDIAAIWSKRF